MPHSQTIAFRLATAPLLPHACISAPLQKIDPAAGHRTCRGAGTIFPWRRFVMRRVTALCAAAGIAVSGLVVASAAQAGYYVIRWDNPGICKIWKEEMTSKPLQWPSDYQVVSK